jgi:hypothetical protein
MLWPPSPYSAWPYTSANDAQRKENIVMSKTNSRTATLATVILSLGFAATGAPSAFAHGRTQTVPRAAVHRHVGHGPAHPGYASPAYSVVPVRAWTYTKPYFRFVPRQSIPDESCDLPSSACSNDERIND